MNKIRDIDPLLTAKDVKNLLRVSLPCVYKFATDGRLRSVRIPCPGNGTKRQRDLIRFKKKDILSFIEEHYG